MIKSTKHNNSLKLKKILKEDLKKIYGGGWGEEFLKWFYPKSRYCKGSNIDIDFKYSL